MTHECTQQDNISNIKENISDIKEDIAEIKMDIKVDLKDVKQDLKDHMSRTAANENQVSVLEAQLAVLKDFVKSAMDNQQKNFDAMLKSNASNQAALNKQLKIAMGILAGVAAIITALAAWL